LDELIAALVAAGDLVSARDVLDVLAGSVAATEAAAVWHLAARVCRLLGDDDGELDRLSRSSGRRSADTVAAVAALGVRLAEARLEVGDTPGALRLLDVALTPADVSEGFDLAHADPPGGSVGALGASVDHTIPSGDVGETVGALVSSLAAAQSEGRNDLVPVLDAAALAAAAEAGDTARLAEIELLRVERRLMAEDLEGALTAARAARRLATEAAYPPLILQVALAESRLVDQRGDRLGSLGVLARAQSELAGSLGDVLARRAVEPELEALSTRWGQACFAEVKAAYDETA
jgi:hypothetical protein